MNVSNKEKQIIFFIGGCLGAVLFLLIFGWDKLDVTYTDWLLRKDTDLAQHYMGWCTYRASNWHYPLGLMDGVLYPDSISVFFTDSIPLFAFLFKLLSGILPESFQYFGLFGFLCYFLQGGFAACLIFHYTNKKIYSIIGSLFFSGSLLMMWRMFTHTALSAHFLILAALYLWLCKDLVLSTIKSILLWTTLSLAALMIQAYFLPMVWGCMLCSILGQFLSVHSESLSNSASFSDTNSASNSDIAYNAASDSISRPVPNKSSNYKHLIIRSILTVLIVGLTTLLCGFAFGMFYGDMPVSGESYGIFSFNLNGFINSQGLTVFLPELPLATPYQVEGLAYLGIGILGLCIMGEIAWLYRTLVNRSQSDHPRLFTKEHIRKAIPYMIFILVFLCLALGYIITLGSHQMTLPLPEKILHLLAIFRCSGRLIWPVYYLILLGACLLPAYYLPDNCLSLIVLILALILQSVDLSSYVKTRLDKFHTEERQVYATPLTDPVWEECANRYRHIMYYPDVYCLYSTKKNEGYAIQIYAYRHSMTMNYIYFSRNLSDTINERMYRHFEALADGYTEPDTMYIFPDQFPVGDYGLHYYYVNDILIGTPDELESGEEIGTQ